MELAIRDGDYVPDGKGGFSTVDGSSELLERVLWKLTVRRGSFPFLPDLGSKLYLLTGEKESNRGTLASSYVAEALADEVDLDIDSVTLEDENLQVNLTWKGESISLTMEV